MASRRLDAAGGEESAPALCRAHLLGGIAITGTLALLLTNLAVPVAATALKVNLFKALPWETPISGRPACGLGLP